MTWTSEQLADLRTYAAEHNVVDSECAMSLIAEVERLRARDAEWEQKAAAWMATPEAAKRLDGYRELAAKVERAEAEVERLREKCDELTINGFSAQLKQLDELRKENARLKDVVAGYSGSGQRIQDLSDDCGLLEECNKKLAAEVERLREAASKFHMDYRAKCDIETKAQAVEIERLRGEREQIRVAVCVGTHWRATSADHTHALARIESILSTKDAGAAGGGG